MIVGAKHSGLKYDGKTDKLFARMLCATRRLRQRPYPDLCQLSSNVKASPLIFVFNFPPS